MEMVKSKVKCPKCSSKNLELIEVWKDHTITWQQHNGEFDRKDGNLESGNPSSVEARCRSCRHQWKVRGALQIVDIIID